MIRLRRVFNFNTLFIFVIGIGGGTSVQWHPTTQGKNQLGRFNLHCKNPCSAKQRRSWNQWFLQVPGFHRKMSTWRCPRRRPQQLWAHSAASHLEFIWKGQCYSELALRFGAHLAQLSFQLFSSRTVVLACWATSVTFLARYLESVFFYRNCCKEE